MKKFFSILNVVLFVLLIAIGIFVVPDYCACQHSDTLTKNIFGSDVECAEDGKVFAEIMFNGFAYLAVVWILANLNNFKKGIINFF